MSMKNLLFLVLLVCFSCIEPNVKDPYKRFLENKIREKWNFSGTPINIFIRQK